MTTNIHGIDAILAALERSGIVPPADQQGAEQ